MTIQFHLIAANIIWTIVQRDNIDFIHLKNSIFGVIIWPKVLQ